MGTTVEKLTYLNTTKQNLKTVINTTGAGLTDESTFRSYANVLNDKILGVINGDVDLFEEYPKVSGNGTDLSLNGVVEGKMSITPQGVSKQESTTGKNLLNVESNLEFTRSKTLQVNIPAGTYHITNNGVTTSDNTDRVTIRFLNNNKTYNLSTSNDYSVTLTSEETIIYLFSHTDYPTSAGVSATITNLMISADGGAYEPYTGGIPAPNPDYPYLVNNVTGENVLKISNSDNSESQTYPISLGNIELCSTPDGTIRDGIIGSSDVSYNLFNKNDVIKGNYQINSSHSLVSSNSNRVLFIPCKPNTTYTVSKKISNYYTIGFINEEPSVNISVTGYMRNPSLEYLTSTSDSDSKYLACWYYNTGETLTEQEILDSIQITEGSEAKPYAPYGQVGMWYKREHIGKVVLDGVTNKFEYKHTTITSETKGFYRTSLPNKNLEFPNGSLGVALSDYFGLVSGTANNAFSNNESGMWWQQTGESVYFILEKTSLADANDWLTTHNTTIYYPLAEYIDIPITDQTLISQLNDIYNNAHSYNGVTNITTTYEDGNEQMYLDIEALKNVWEVTE